MAFMLVLLESILWNFRQSVGEIHQKSPNFPEVKPCVFFPKERRLGNFLNTRGGLFDL